jgi:hypothetical protein
MASPDGTGPYWGARYTRTWFTTLAGLPLLCAIFFAVLGGSDAWIVLVPLGVVIVAVIWSVPLSVVSTGGIRLVLRREVVAWPDVAAVLDPRTGDEEVRIELVDGRVRAVPGVPPRITAALRSLHNANR